MKAIVDALLEISLYAAVIAAAILLFRCLFQKSVSPKLQYLIWMLLVVRLMVPVTFESGFHVESLFPAAAQAPAAAVITPTAQPAAESQAPVENAGTATLRPAAAAPGAAVESAAPKPRVDSYTLATIVWLSGAALFAAWLLAVKLRFYRRMARARVETPPGAAALYEKCRALAGAKRRLPLWAVDAALSPGIALFGGPVLLVPASMLASEEALRFALLHELTHRRRGDHLVSALLNVLRIVYWFHPAVHYAFSQMRADMEIACDHDVTRLLEPSEKKGYLTAILELFSCEVQPQLGMAQFRTRRMARRRMKGAFMKNKTTAFAKLAACLLAAILIAGCFTTACQSAPVKAGEPPQTAAPQSVPSPTPQEGGSVYVPISVTDAPRGSYTVFFRDGGAYADTGVNIQKALALLTAGGGTVVQPGAEWSFLGFFGSLYDENGADKWVTGPGIINGDYLETGGFPGIGCVSAAIYDAALSAGLTVTERHRHAWAPAYVDSGLDASITYGMHDLKFKNSTGAPVTILGGIGELENGLRPLTIQIWGAPLEEGVEYALRSETIATEAAGETTYQDDPSLPAGMWEWAVVPRDGSMIEVYRDTYQNGKLTQSELLYTDFYRAVSGVMLKGTKTPYLLTDMSDAELAALAKTLYEAYLYDSGSHTNDEIGEHYARLFRLLEIDLGGSISDNTGAVGFTIGVPMEKFKLEKCWPYAAVLFALDPDVAQMDIGSMDYTGEPATTLVRIRRGDVEAHYGGALTQTLSEYAKTEAGLAELLQTVTRFE